MMTPRHNRRSPHRWSHRDITTNAAIAGNETIQTAVRVLVELARLSLPELRLTVAIDPSTKSAVESPVCEPSKLNVPPSLLSCFR